MTALQVLKLQAAVQFCGGICQQTSREAFKKVHNWLSRLSGECADSAEAATELSLSLMGGNPAFMDFTVTSSGSFPHLL